jgi:hypothetical protein
LPNRIYFSEVAKKISQFINNEKIYLEEAFLQSLLRFLSKVCNYEEEETKIRPKLIITKNFKEALKTVPYHSKIVRGKGKKTGEDFDKMIKSIIPFCNLGWFVYIDIQEDDIEYGIVRSFSGPKGLTLTETLFSDLNEESVSIVEISVPSKFEIYLQGINQEKLIVDFRLINEDHLDFSTMIKSMSEDIVSQIEDQETRESLKNVFYKLLKLPQQKVHGTICMVVNKDYNFPNEFLSDGIWFDTPINLAEAALFTIKETQDIYLGEKYYGLSGLFIEMMNMDGITVIDTQGKIRGYNLFINKQKIVQPSKMITGGARKRAFYSLLETKDPGIVGVYFQSQDGEIIYERMSEYHDRK